MRKAVQVAWISKQIGGWKNARSRGYYRVSVVDLDKAVHQPHQSPYNSKVTVYHKILQREKACLDIAWESTDCTRDYAGGYYGFSHKENEAREYGKKLAREYHCKYYECDL